MSFDKTTPTVGKPPSGSGDHGNGSRRTPGDRLSALVPSALTFARTVWPGSNSLPGGGPCAVQEDFSRRIGLTSHRLAASLVRAEAWRFGETRAEPSPAADGCRDPWHAAVCGAGTTRSGWPVGATRRSGRERHEGLVCMPFRGQRRVSRDGSTRLTLAQSETTSLGAGRLGFRIPIPFDLSL
jgi:hypothetical protein